MESSESEEGFHGLGHQYALDTDFTGTIINETSPQHARLHNRLKAVGRRRISSINLHELSTHPDSSGTGNRI